MKIHHLNCGSLYPRFPRAESIVYCLLIETNQGLVLVDTGFGRQDYSNPSLFMRTFLNWMGVPCQMEETAACQIEALGYKHSDVRHIVLTHLHLDHAGGLRDFPEASVHVYRAEYNAVMNPRGLMDRVYDHAQWSHGPNWVVHEDADVDWFGLKSRSIIEELTPEMRFVPLPGHTRGHCGVAIAAERGWLFHCGDAASPLHPLSDLHGLDSSHHTASVLPDWFARRVLGVHIPKLRTLLKEHGDEIEIISAHDLYSFQKYTSNVGLHTHPDPS